MDNNCSGSDLQPTLIVIEGPAACGKTTLAHSVTTLLRQRGESVFMASEFSDSWLGNELRLRSNRCLSSKPDWSLGLGGAVSYLADKITNLECALQSKMDWVVLDRGPLSQRVLGAFALTEREDERHLQLIVDGTDAWLKARFSAASRVWVIVPPLSTLTQRLEARCARALSEAELARCRLEFNCYSAAATMRLPFPARSVQWDAAVTETSKLLIAQLGIE